MTLIDSGCIEIQALPSVPIRALCLSLTIVLENVRLVTSLESVLTFARVGAQIGMPPR